MKIKLSLNRRRDIKGVVFVIPLIIGLALFFIAPMIESATFSFHRVSYGAEGIVREFVGWTNYSDIFLNTNLNLSALSVSITAMLTSLPLILIFSLFAAMLVNKRFKGRSFARAVFFLPVIMSSGILANYDANITLLFNKGLAESQLAQNVSATAKLTEIMMQSNLDSRIVNYVTMAIGSIYSIVNDSGFQILVFLAALKTVPGELREASLIDGATEWEIFWKVTLPIISPYVLVNAVYTVIDSFTTSGNAMVTAINEQMFMRVNIGAASALAWSYAGIILLVLAVIALFSRKLVFYNE